MTQTEMEAEPVSRAIDKQYISPIPTDPSARVPRLVADDIEKSTIHDGTFKIVIPEV